MLILPGVLVSCAAVLMMQLQKDMEEAARKVWADDEATKTFDQEAVARIRQEAGIA